MSPKHGASRELLTSDDTFHRIDMVAAESGDAVPNPKTATYNLEAAPGKGDLPDTEPDRSHLAVRALWPCQNLSVAVPHILILKLLQCRRGSLSVDEISLLVLSAPGARGVFAGTCLKRKKSTSFLSGGEVHSQMEYSRRWC